MTTSPEGIKACCAAVYSGDAVGLLLGQSYHPGGAALTRRLAEQLALSHSGPRRRVADIACGPGATACLLAGDYAVTVDGVDLSEDNLARARTSAEKAGLGQRVCFHHGDAERIPLPANTFDALFCECALCTFPDKSAAAGEFARILRPGGLVGITDVTVSEAGLPPELTTLTAWVACIADARSLSDYTRILAGAGLRTRHSESHDDALLRMIERIDARITALRVAAPDLLADNGVQPDTVHAYTRLAREAVAAGRIGYTLIVAEKT
jgi:SAM-dependent methyltransferase